MLVEKWNEHYEGEVTEKAMRRKLESRGYSVSCYVYPPGTYFPDHAHASDKIDGVLSGQFKLTMGGQSVILQTGDCVMVPKGVVHSAEVIGNQPVVSLDAVKV